MQLATQTKNLLRNIARGWKQNAGCLPCEIKVADWGFHAGHLHCSRPVVLVTFAGRGGKDGAFVEDVFIRECDTFAEARKYAGLCKSSMHQAYDRAPAYQSIKAVA